MTPEQAMTLALKALEFIASDDYLMRRFLNESGLDHDSIRQGVHDPGFLSGIVDFLLSDEASLIAFCEKDGFDPGDPAAARQVLPGGEQVNWT